MSQVTDRFEVEALFPEIDGKILLDAMDAAGVEDSFGFEISSFGFHDGARVVGVFSFRGTESGFANLIAFAATEAIVGDYTPSDSRSLIRSARSLRKFAKSVF
jgi:hypothetical protein